MKLCDIPEEVRPCVEFGCKLCIEKRNLTRIGKQKQARCALRSIRFEICDEMERVINSVGGKDGG